MKDLLDFFASDWGALRFVAGFVIAPLIYLRDRAEVHKAYAEHAKVLVTDREGLSGERLAALRAKLHVFELEWWLVAAITVLFVGVFLMGGLAKWSERLNGQCPGKEDLVVMIGEREPGEVDISVEGRHWQARSLTRDVSQEDLRQLLELERAQTLDPCEITQGVLNGFGFGLALMAVFCVRWAKAEAFRELQRCSFETATSAGTGIANHDDGDRPETGENDS